MSVTTAPGLKSDHSMGTQSVRQNGIEWARKAFENETGIYTEREMAKAVRQGVHIPFRDITAITNQHVLSRRAL